MKKAKRENNVVYGLTPVKSGDCEDYDCRNRNVPLYPLSTKRG